MALYGYHPPSITSYLRENSKVQAVEDHIEHQQEVLQLLNDNLNGIGDVLMQEGRPIYFESFPIKGKYLQKAIYEKEMLAILHALKKW